MLPPAQPIPHHPLELSRKTNGLIAHDQHLVDPLDRMQARLLNDGLRRAVQRPLVLQRRRSMIERANLCANAHRPPPFTQEAFRFSPWTSRGGADKGDPSFKHDRLQPIPPHRPHFPFVQRQDDLCARRSLGRREDELFRARSLEKREEPVELDGRWVEVDRQCA